MEIVWEVLFLLQANFFVCISGMGRAGVTGGFVLCCLECIGFYCVQDTQVASQVGRGGGVWQRSFQLCGFAAFRIKNLLHPR